MWANISAEASYQHNFNIGFSTLKSDIIIHLAQWQYWWWFWFSLVWALYYLIILKTIRFRLIKTKPKISTSFRPHGKWGDFLACVIPLSWCINILTNSNLILRLIEWQNESSLFTVRVRARQWYWIYKFELKNFTDILATPKNIGNNKWLINIFGDLKIANNYLHIIQIRSQNNWVKNYWDKSILDTTKLNKINIITPQEQLRLNLINQYDLNCLNNLNVYNINYIYNSLNYLPLYNIFNYKGNSVIFKIPYIKKDFLSNNNILNNFNFNFFYKNTNKNHEDFDEYNRWLKKSYGKITPTRFIKLPININSLDLNIFRFRFNDDSNKLIHKIIPDNIYLTLKQKRYNRKKTINLQVINYKNDLGVSLKKIKYSGKPYLNNNKILEQLDYNYTTSYKLLKKNKTRNELIPVTLARRLLRTKKTLVLPAHVNITLITNSYDIVHSWFIPGLGIKLDCVPGRSTHHTFFIDNIGFYYGQCAEICGRYHHHMPIRVCALSFEHFLLWWHSFGLPKMLNLISKKKYELHYEFRKYTW